LPGWAWDAAVYRWEVGYLQLKDYAIQEGHARPPHGHQSADGFELGNWASKQRIAKTGFSDERRAKLESLPGWTWNMTEYKWHKGFDCLCAYVEENGHARVPTQNVTQEGFLLGSWVSNQRTKHRNHRLSAVQIDSLEAIEGWVWKAGDS
jgi:hypothetical protein